MHRKINLDDYEIVLNEENGKIDVTVTNLDTDKEVHYKNVHEISENQDKILIQLISELDGTGDVLERLEDCDFERHRVLAKVLSQINRTDWVEILMDIEETKWNSFEWEGEEWLVLTESEADEKAKDYVREILEELLKEIPNTLRPYFDEDRYTEDAIKSDGHANFLASYDGNEYEEFDKSSGTWYYCYRTN